MSFNVFSFNIYVDLIFRMITYVSKLSLRTGRKLVPDIYINCVVNNSQKIGGSGIMVRIDE
ncbi:hypothetical protein HZS_6290 [Henneguya salminicola]|nr:hypothetical protein HZS_6290 [Henneguya salminicola]